MDILDFILSRDVRGLARRAAQNSINTNAGMITAISQERRRLLQEVWGLLQDNPNDWEFPGIYTNLSDAGVEILNILDSGATGMYFMSGKGCIETVPLISIGWGAVGTGDFGLVVNTDFREGQLPNTLFSGVTRGNPNDEFIDYRPVGRFVPPNQQIKIKSERVGVSEITLGLQLSFKKG